MILRAIKRMFRKIDSFFDGNVPLRYTQMVHELDFYIDNGKVYEECKRYGKTARHATPTEIMLWWILMYVATSNGGWDFKTDFGEEWEECH
jgi:hypothetical protein